MRWRQKTEQPARGSRRYNRTPLTTYYRSEDGSQRRSPFQKKPAPKNHRKYIFGAVDIVLLACLLLVLVYSLLLNGSPRVTATDNSYHSNADYATAIRSDLSSWRNRNKISFNQADIVKKIEGQFPEIRSVSVELPFLSEQPRFGLAISAPAFKLASRGQTYVVDLDGVTVIPYQDQANFQGLATVDDQSGYPAAAGKQVISSQSAAFIYTVIKESQRAKVPLSNLVLPAVPLEFDLHTKDQPYLVKFYLNGDADIETGQFLAARQKLSQSHITPSQYLDVRVQGKIFYK